MLNPFGLIILIAVSAIKTTDAFVQLWGLQNVTKRFWRPQSMFVKVDLWLIVAPHPHADCSRVQGHPTMQARFFWRCVQGCGARYHRERTAPFQRWVEKHSKCLSLLDACSNCGTVSTCTFVVVHARAHVLHFHTRDILFFASVQLCDVVSYVVCLVDRPLGGVHPPFCWHAAFRLRYARCWRHTGSCTVVNTLSRCLTQQLAFVLKCCKIVFISLGALFVAENEDQLGTDLNTYATLMKLLNIQCIVPMH